MKFKKKPVEVEATQWFGMGDHPNVYMKVDKNGPVTMPVPWIDTLEGGHRVSAGDWIITGVNGEQYPCKPDIFEKTYCAATGGQESEEQAEVWLLEKVKIDGSSELEPLYVATWNYHGQLDEGGYEVVFTKNPYRAIRFHSEEKANGLKHISENLKATSHIFESAPPSALAIEAAALRKAAEVCIAESEKWAHGQLLVKDCADAILATLPQDGIVALEEFGVMCARAGEVSRLAARFRTEEEHRALVHSLIGEKK